MAASDFKIIIAGGGPVGLTAAIALAKAGIRFILLERRSQVIIDAGSNLVMLPNGMRALYQLGLGDSLDKVSSALSNVDVFNHQGRYTGDLQWLNLLEQNFGAFPRVLSREDLTRILYEAVPEDARSNIYVNKKVSNITVEGESTIVHCADGTSYSGSAVIGADGVHSVIRANMRTLALAAGASEVNKEQPYLTTFRCLWFRVPSSTVNLKPGTTLETHGSGAATQLFVGEDSAVIGLYETLDEPTRVRFRFTEADEAAVVERWGNLALTAGGSLTLRMAYDRRIQSGLVSLEEGVTEHWSWDGRIVLVGDAAHKYTPSTGAGCNTGVLDIVTLANELHKVVSNAEVGAPSRQEMASAFNAYQKSRYAGVVDGCQRAGMVTSMTTWRTWKLWFLDQYVFSWHFVQRYLAKFVAVKYASMEVFSYIKATERMVGRHPWVNSFPASAKAK
ncbi:unnamed protein product [Clonostachys byssicola]|uniref:FAD-binding domain-containing protein n=1 Tax=Clonostachys byssicola TaxID=160290 RepID=A0A9N9UBU6_9HYPO|nr:unnamed protein product [Clonostachys byssicola]